MTKREFLTAIMNGEMNDELQAYAVAEIDKMNEKNAQRKNKPSKTSIENEPIKAQMLELLATEPMTAPDIAEHLEISTQKASSLARQLADDGKLEVTEIKVPKKGKRKLYTFIEKVED